MILRLVLTSYYHRQGLSAYYDCMPDRTTIYDCRSDLSASHNCRADLVTIYDCRNDLSVAVNLWLVVTTFYVYWRAMIVGLALVRAVIVEVPFFGPHKMAASRIADVMKN
jgi:hypothetical protein